MDFRPATVFCDLTTGASKISGRSRMGICTTARRVQGLESICLAANVVIGAGDTSVFSAFCSVRAPEPVRPTHYPVVA